MVPHQTVSLVGLPGAGKSAVGRTLARKLNCRFEDTDAHIERRLGEPIRTFFEREGEETFRALEHEILLELCDSANGIGVLSTGGGSVLRGDNRQLLKASSTVIYLRAQPEELFRRLRYDRTRPLLQVADPWAKLKTLHGERDPIYKEVSDFIIETGRPTVQALVGMILMQLELAGCIDPSRVASVVEPTH